MEVSGPASPSLRPNLTRKLLNHPACRKSQCICARQQDVSPPPKRCWSDAATMHLRPATLADLPATASMSVDAFWNDELYVYTNPWRTRYPDDFRDSFLRRNRRRYWSPDFICHVAVTDPGDEGHRSGGRVVGYAVWERKGTSEEAKAWRRQTWRGCRHDQSVSRRCI